MTDLVAPQVTEAVAAALPPQGMSITLFDWSPILGVPFWIFIDCFLLFCLAAVIVWWFAKIRKLDAVKGWSESLKHMDVHDVQVWMISRTQKLVIGCMKIEDNVLSYHDTSKIGMWHHNTRESVIRVGGNPAVVVSEDYDQTRDIISEIALTDNCDEFNANQASLANTDIEDYEDTLKDAVESGDAKAAESALGEWKKAMALHDDENNKTIPPINDYLDYESHGREALQIVHPNGLPMKSYNIFSNIRFLKYFPLGCSHMFFGGELTFDAKHLHPNKSTKGFWEKHAFLVLAAIVALLAIVAAWMVPLGGH